MKAAKVVPLRRVQGSAAELSDEALVAACAVGDVPALGALFDRHHAAVYRFLARVSQADRQDLDDLVQATFYEVFRAAKGFRGAGAVLTWIFAIAVNVTRHHVRGEARRRSFIALAARHPVDAIATPYDLTERGELLARVQTALAELPRDLRIAFVLCDVEGVRGVDAARALGVREGTLWRRLHDARKALRAAIEGEMP